MRTRKRSSARARAMLVAIGCILVSCTQSSSRATARDTAAEELLWLPAGARVQRDLARPALVRNGRSIYVDGSGAVSFTLAANCDDVATTLVEHFEHTEWRPRFTELINPGLATSFGHGCRTHGGGILQVDSNGRPIPRGPYIDWHGEWENARGDTVTYVVGGIDEQLQGYASYVPRHVVDHIR